MVESAGRRCRFWQEIYDSGTGIFPTMKQGRGNETGMDLPVIPVLSRNHLTRIFNTMSKPTHRGSLGRLVGASLGRSLNTLILHGGQGEGRTPWTASPTGGERGVTLINQKNLRRLTGFYPAATECNEFGIPHLPVIPETLHHTL